jgi:hypothetical protein
VQEQFASPCVIVVGDVLNVYIKLKRVLKKQDGFKFEAQGS